MNYRVIFGALAAMFSAIIGMQAFGEKNEYPVLTKFFDGEAIVVRNLIFFVATLGAAGCGYLSTVHPGKEQVK